MLLLSPRHTDFTHSPLSVSHCTGLLNRLALKSSSFYRTHPPQTLSTTSFIHPHILPNSLPPSLHITTVVAVLCFTVLTLLARALAMSSCCPLGSVSSTIGTKTDSLPGHQCQAVDWPHYFIKVNLGVFEPLPSPFFSEATAVYIKRLHSCYTRSNSKRFHKNEPIYLL